MEEHIGMTEIARNSTVLYVKLGKLCIHLLFVTTAYTPWCRLGNSRINEPCFTYVPTEMDESRVYV